MIFLIMLTLVIIRLLVLLSRLIFIILLLMVTPLLDLTLYRTIVGILVYLTISHPNIAYVIHLISQFIISSIIVHWVVVLCILKCLWGTLFQCLLLLSTFSLELCTYSNVDWVSDLENHNSSIGFCLFFGDALIS